MKAMGRSNRTLKDLAEEFGAQGEYRQLYQAAQLGRQYEKELQDKVVRLCLQLDLGAEEQVLRGIAEKAGAEDLQKLRLALEERVRMLQPMVTQLPQAGAIRGELESGFLI